MSEVPLQSDVYLSSVFHQTDEGRFQLGHFDRFVNGYGEIICPENDFRYIFGPESIDLGPCCNPCDENWIKILKNGEFIRILILYMYFDLCRLRCYIFLAVTISTSQHCKLYFTELLVVDLSRQFERTSLFRETCIHEV